MTIQTWRVIPILKTLFQIIQWYPNASQDIGVYEPNYTEASGDGKGKLLWWKSDRLRWQTPDGAWPVDRSKECSILTGLAEVTELECEHAIILAFVIGFGVLLVVILLVFTFLKRR